MSNLIPMFDDHSHTQINRLIKEKALRCPHCGAHQTSLTFMSECRLRPRYVVACTECKFEGRLGHDLADAVRKWNAGEPWWKTGAFATFLGIKKGTRS
jgi:predicted RNA-binding Zn-ribbon protein involved in translation (DUF1610 family)